MNPQTVMVADDELHLTRILQAKFQQAGFRVIVANDGEEAFELAFERRPDLVISDHQMPVMDGFEMCVKLRNTPETSEIPVLMLTALGHKLTPSQLARTNIRHLMGKPFSTRELIDIATETLRECAGGDESNQLASDDPAMA